MKSVASTSSTLITMEDPPVARFLFSDVRFSWFWLIIRLYTGYEWFTAGWEKVTSPAWVGAQAGTALTGFVNGALKQTTGAHPNDQGCLELFRFLHNSHRFPRGKRAGLSPAELAGIPLPDDPLSLLGFAPKCQSNSLPS